jgi:hypothetical protein
MQASVSTIANYAFQDSPAVVVQRGMVSAFDVNGIRRRSDGSPDFDFYRHRATALRAQAIRETTNLRAFGGMLTTAAAIGLVALVARLLVT